MRLIIYPGNSVGIELIAAESANATFFFFFYFVDIKNVGYYNVVEKKSVLQIDLYVINN